MSLETAIFGQNTDDIPTEILEMSADDIRTRVRLLENEIRVQLMLLPLHFIILVLQVLTDESKRLELDKNQLRDRIRENQEKVNY